MIADTDVVEEFIASMLLFTVMFVAIGRTPSPCTKVTLPSALRARTFFDSEDEDDEMLRLKKLAFY